MLTKLARLLELLALRSAELLNASNLANALGLHRSTVDHYIAVLERLFLGATPSPAWRRKPHETAHQSTQGPSPSIPDWPQPSPT